MGFRPNELGIVLRKHRTAAGLTLEDVADRVGITPGALSHIESGRRLPQPQNAARIASVLGLEPDYLLAMLDEEHAKRRRQSVNESRAADSDAVPPRTAKAYRARPIGDLFAPPDASELARHASFSASAAPYGASQGIAPPDVPDALPMDTPARARRSSPADALGGLRDLARWSHDTSTRIEALDGLADSAAEAIRTLRGLLGDDDPVVRAEARRLLLELDVRIPEE